MRKRVWIICVAILAICVLFLLRKDAEQPRVVPSDQSETLTASSSQSEQQKSVENQHVPSPSEKPRVPPAAVAPLASPEDSNALAAQMLTTWQAPIEFYGKVVDENDHPVSAAQVRFHWVETPDESGNRTSTAESDAEGLFSLRGARGPNLSVSVSKEGYYTSREKHPAFKYEFFANPDFSPDPQKPIIFHLRKKGTPEPLVALKRNYRIPRDGTALAIDLISGQTVKGEGGNLVVQCWTYDQGKGSGQKYDWRCLVTIPGGGLALTDAEFPFFAPENGYNPSAEISMPVDRPDWKSDVDVKFFYRLADGRYGRMTFSMIAGGQHFCMIDSVLNPSGSRNLEPAH